MNNWIEINSQDDLPDGEVFCWWINRTNGYMFPSNLNSHLGRSLAHLTFSHYMIIADVPKPPIERKQLDELQKLEVEDALNINKILRDKL